MPLLFSFTRASTVTLGQQTGTFSTGAIHYGTRCTNVPPCGSQQLSQAHEPDTIRTRLKHVLTPGRISIKLQPQTKASFQPLMARRRRRKHMGWSPRPTAHSTPWSCLFESGLSERRQAEHSCCICPPQLGLGVVVDFLQVLISRTDTQVDA